MQFYIGFTCFVVVFISCISGIDSRFPEAGPQLTLCAAATAETTLKTFWQNTREKCSLDARKLVELYEKSHVKSDDKCGRLLRHHIARTLIERTAIIYTEALVGQSFSANVDIPYLADRLLHYDTRDANSQHVRAMWRQVFQEFDYFRETSVFLGPIFESSIAADVKATALEIWSQSGDHAGGHMEAFASAYTKLRNASKSSLALRLVDLFQALPEGLKLLYGSDSKQTFGLLNVRHNEFLYAPRDNGPAPELRTPLTWSKEKNSTDSDGQLRIELSAANETVAIGSFYGPLLKYLYVDDSREGVYFWIGDKAMPNRWWSPMFSEGAFSFRNAKTGQRLCATREYDENRRYVTLQLEDELEDNSCRWWLVTL